MKLGIALFWTMNLFTDCAVKTALHWVKIAIAVHCSSFLALLWLGTALKSALWGAASLWWAWWSVWTPCVPSSGQTPACPSPFPTRLVLSLLKTRTIIWTDSCLSPFPTRLVLSRIKKSLPEIAQEPARKSCFPLKTQACSFHDAQAVPSSWWAGKRRYYYHYYYKQYQYSHAHGRSSSQASLGVVAVAILHTSWLDLKAEQCS